MLTLQEHDPILNDADDDDMTPITAFSADPTISFESGWDNPICPEPSIETAEPFEPQPAYNGGPERTSHNKKRDASYIPRPPNAFILFRSSFIKSQQVPEKVEGNHSTLSKIIGKYWKTLPREEREVWEAKAVVAQAEHRRRYPDWRFRPGANALAKLKAELSRRTNKKNNDARCAIIADLLVEGKTGVDLEDAVRKWEDSKGSAMADWNKARPIEERKRDGDEALTVPKKEGVICEEKPRRQFLDESKQRGPASQQSTSPLANTRCCRQSASRSRSRPCSGRSLSAPASHSPLEPQRSPPTDPYHDLLGGAFVSISYETFEPQFNSSRYPSPYSFPTEEERHQYEVAHAVLGEPVCDLSPLVPPSTLGEGVPTRWNDPYNLLKTSMGAPPLSPPYISSSSLEEPSAVYGLMDPDETNVSVTSLNEVSCCRSHNVLMKDWPDSCISPYTQSPIFINEFGGGQNVYNWSSGEDGETMFVTTPTPTGYATSELGGVELVRVHGGYPAAVKY
ncbi:hypothetical protein EDC04DRAFT_2719281 [Pisolithus marmoratus]|nr:hypothetical protein EDC04DRAFT_2719281 [Pisolithus marmoratus]